MDKNKMWKKCASVKCALCAELLRYKDAYLASNGRFYCRSCFEQVQHSGYKRDY